MPVMVTRSDQERIDGMARDVWAHVFVMLDGEPDLDTDDAGRAASMAEEAVRRVLCKAWRVNR